MAYGKSMSPETTPETSGNVLPTPYTQHHDHSFTLQAIMELQRSVGGMTSALNGVKESVEKLEERIGKSEEKLSGVTHKMYAATVLLAILVAIGGFLINKAWDAWDIDVTRNHESTSKK